MAPIAKIKPGPNGRSRCRTHLSARPIKSTFPWSPLHIRLPQLNQTRSPESIHIQDSAPSHFGHDKERAGLMKSPPNLSAS